MLQSNGRAGHDKRRVYQLMLPILALVAWLVVAADTYFALLTEFYGAIVLVAGAAMTLLGIASHVRQLPLRTIEGTMLVTTLGVHSIVLVRALYLDGAGVLSAPAVAVWVWLPSFYLMLFMVLSDRAALRASAAVLLYLGALTAPTFASSFGPLGSGRTVFVLLQVYLSHAVLIGVIYFMSAFRQRFQRMEVTANTMRKLANTDALTGLRNRRSLERILADEVARAERYHRPLSVVLTDIDDFKRLNDRHGHPAGDRVLVDLASRLTFSVRSADRVGRWGGEEFLIVTPETDLEAAVKLAEAVRSHVAEGTVGEGHVIGISLGVASYCDGDRVSDLIDRADAALYHAKWTGKNRVVSEREVTPAVVPST
jgi:diguanylate cyclase (GGDEF)-like protein